MRRLRALGLSPAALLEMMPVYRLLTLGGSALVIPALYLRTIGDPAGRAALRERLGHLEPWPDTASGNGLHGTTASGTGRSTRVWVQAVSLGEVRVAQTFLTALRTSRPRIGIALSATTPAGLEYAARLAATPGAPAPPAHGVSGLIPARIVDRSFAFPLDVSVFVRRALDALAPSAYGSVETEIWPGLLRECGRRGVPSFIVNGSISERSAGRYRWLGESLLGALGAVKAACMQSDDDASRILALGVPSGAVAVTGNIKFDAGRDDLTERADALRQAMVLPHGTKVLVAGSTSPGEEEIVVEAWRRAASSIRGLVLVVAPRHRERFDEAAGVLAAAGANVLRRSRSTGTNPPKEGDVILLDTLGELEAAYALAQVAFVGGSLAPRGGQNPLEPARAGVPVLFGPGMDNFREVADALLACGGASEVRDAASLAETIVRLFADAVLRERTSIAARGFVEAHAGATRRTLDTLARLIPEVFA